MDKWSWEKSNGIATDEQTLLAYETLTTKQLISNFHHFVWNDLVEFISKVRKSTWDDTILSKIDTKMTENDKTLTAKRFNALYTQLEVTDWSWRIDNTKPWYIGDRLFRGIEDNLGTPDYVYGLYILEIVEKANLAI